MLTPCRRQPLWVDDMAPVMLSLMPAEVATTSTFHVHDAPGARLTLSMEMKVDPGADVADVAAAVVDESGG